MRKCVSLSLQLSSRVECSHILCWILNEMQLSLPQKCCPQHECAYLVTVLLSYRAACTACALSVTFCQSISRVACSSRAAAGVIFLCDSIFVNAETSVVFFVNDNLIRGASGAETLHLLELTREVVDFACQDWWVGGI